MTATEVSSTSEAAVGRALGTIGVWGNIGRGFAHPVDVAHDRATDRLYVLNRSTSWSSPHGRAVRVSVLDRAAADAEVVHEFAKRGSGPGELMAPVAIAVGGDGQVAISDEHHHSVELFDAEGGFVRRIGGRGDEPGRFHHPAGVVADRDGLWIADAVNDRIQHVSWEGEPIAVLGGPGLGPGQLDHPWLIDLDADGRVWVADWGNDRVQCLDPDGRCLEVIGSPGGEPFQRPSAVVCGPAGRLHVADWGRRRLAVFDGDRQRVDLWYGDAEPSPWAEERMVEFPGMADGRRASGDPAGERLLGRPGGLCVLPGGDVLVTDTGRHRIQRYRSGSVRAR